MADWLLRAFDNLDLSKQSQDHDALANACWANWLLLNEPSQTRSTYDAVDLTTQALVTTEDWSARMLGVLDALHAFRDVASKQDETQTPAVEDADAEEEEEDVEIDVGLAANDGSDGCDAHPCGAGTWKSAMEALKRMRDGEEDVDVPWLLHLQRVHSTAPCAEGAADVEVVGKTVHFVDEKGARVGKLVVTKLKKAGRARSG